MCLFDQSGSWYFIFLYKFFEYIFQLYKLRVDMVSKLTGNIIIKLIVNLIIILISVFKNICKEFIWENFHLSQGIHFENVIEKGLCNIYQTSEGDSAVK